MIPGAKRTMIDDLMKKQQGFPMVKPRCPTCEYERHPVELIVTGDTYLCTHCMADAERAIPDVVNIEEEWNNVKGKRNLLLEQYSWTVRRGSPLNKACQDAFEALFKKLHKLTVTHATPAAVVWPDIPPLVYGD